MLTVGLLVLFAVLSVRAVVFWQRVKQGADPLRTSAATCAQVAAWQLAAWLLRFGAFFFFLEAFNVGGSVENALLVMSVQALSTLTPFTPGGAGAQQALLVYVFRGIAPKATVLAYSVGQQIAIAAFNVLAALIALFLMAGTTDFRKIVRLGARRRSARLGRRLEQSCRLSEALARLAHECHGFGKEHPDRVADLRGLLAGGPGEVERVDRGDRHVDRQLDRVVGPGDALRSLHLLRELAAAGAADRPDHRTCRRTDLVSSSIVGRVRSAGG